MEATIDEPADHEYFKDGSYYKVNKSHKRVMIWLNGHWGASGKTLKELLKGDPKPPGSGRSGKPCQRQRGAPVDPSEAIADDRGAASAV